MAYIATQDVTLPLLPLDGGGLSDQQLEDIAVMLEEEDYKRRLGLSQESTTKGGQVPNKKWDEFRDRSIVDRLGERPEDEAGAKAWDQAVSNILSREKQEDEAERREAERAAIKAEAERRYAKEKAEGTREAAIEAHLNQLRARDAA
jgi:hypothetical protein